MISLLDDMILIAVSGDILHSYTITIAVQAVISLRDLMAAAFCCSMGNEVITASGEIFE